MTTEQIPTKPQTTAIAGHRRRRPSSIGHEIGSRDRRETETATSVAALAGPALAEAVDRSRWLTKWCDRIVDDLGASRHYDALQNFETYLEDLHRFLDLLVHAAFEPRNQQTGASEIIREYVVDFLEVVDRTSERLEQRDFDRLPMALSRGIAGALRRCPNLVSRVCVFQAAQLSNGSIWNDAANE
jgi:hypothetical protein